MTALWGGTQDSRPQACRDGRDRSAGGGLCERRRVLPGRGHAGLRQGRSQDRHQPRPEGSRQVFGVRPVLVRHQLQLRHAGARLFESRRVPDPQRRPGRRRAQLRPRQGGAAARGEGQQAERHRHGLSRRVRGLLEGRRQVARDRRLPRGHDPRRRRVALYLLRRQGRRRAGRPARDAAARHRARRQPARVRRTRCCPWCHPPCRCWRDPRPGRPMPTSGCCPRASTIPPFGRARSTIQWSADPRRWRPARSRPAEDPLRVSAAGNPGRGRACPGAPG